MQHSTEPDPRAVAALRAGSVAAREPLATAAGAPSVRELLAAVRAGDLPAGVDPWLAGELARVIALQDLRPGDRTDALALLAVLPPTSHRWLHAQLALDAGDLTLVRALLDD